ncbi:MAG: Deoxyribodipyrimidine photolyase, partial [uncultured Ramlibacter sp.]
QPGQPEPEVRRRRPLHRALPAAAGEAAGRRAARALARSPDRPRRSRAGAGPGLPGADRRPRAGAGGDAAALLGGEAAGGDRRCRRPV